MDADMLTALWWDAHCGFVVPFPRLDAMRRNMQFALDNRDEYEALLAKERAYYAERTKAQTAYFDALAEAVAREQGAT